MAGLHVQGERARLVVATREAGGSAWTVTSRSTHAPGDWASINAELNKARVGVLVRVVPGSQTIARVVTLPESERPATDPELVGTLGLLAEAELPGSLPEYRRAGGVLAIGSGAGAPVVVGWTGAPAAGGERGGRGPAACPVVWTAEVVALAALARAVSGGGSGGRGGELAAYVDGADRACAVIAAGAGKTVVRTTRLGGDDARASAVRVIADAAKAAGVDVGAGVDLGGGSGEVFRVVVRPGAGAGSRGVMGVTIEPGAAAGPGGVLSEFGLAMGAVLAATDARPAVRALVNLHEREPRGRAMLVERVVRWLGSPARGAAVLAVCLAAVLAAPLGVAYARYATLRERTKADTGLEERLRSGERELAHYRLLREKRWPMTKLLADIAGAAPVGVIVEALDVSGDSGVTIRGTATSGELITSFRENLGKTKVFTQVATPSIGSGGGLSGLGGSGGGEAQIAFQLTARVAPGGATFNAPPIEDFAARTLSERMYGEGRVSAPGGARAAGRERAARTETSRPSSRTSASTGAASGRAAASSSSATRTSSAGRTSTSGGSAADKVVIPPPISDAEIQKLERGKAMMEWAQRKAAAAQPGVDAATKARLLDESAKAKERMDALRNAGPGARGGGQ